MREHFSVCDLQAALGDYTCLVKSFFHLDKREYLTILAQRLIGDYGYTEVLAPLLHEGGVAVCNTQEWVDVEARCGKSTWDCQDSIGI